jgi:hypothetical protein
MPGMGDTSKKKAASKPKTKPSKAPPKKTAVKGKATAKAGAKKRSVAKKSPATTKKPTTATRPATSSMPAHSDSAHKAMSADHADSAKTDASHSAHSPDSTRVKKPMQMEHPAGGTMPGTSAPPAPIADSSRTHVGHDMPSGPLSLSMDRMGSGTTWIPDAVTLPSRHKILGAWEVMAHGFVFGQYDHQSSRRGDDQLGSLNWAMLMASRRLAGGHFQARTMLSLDPATVTPKGYPLLLQTGESFEGEPLHDRQHPHDFFMELGVLYQREFNNRIAWSLYAAPSGEPALGPVAFMHRPSAMDNPSAPLSHHWQDATHTTFGVITAGIFTRRWQLEGSIFNGREPDEHRWNIDPIKLDSYSGRVTVNPTDAWSLAAGYGYLKSPEGIHPDEPMHRITASALHGRKIGADGKATSALVWGVNRHGGDSKATNSILLENETIFDKHNTVFGRAEVVQKTGEDLVLDEGTIDNASGTRFNLGAFQLGYIRELTRLRWATIGLGAAGTVNLVPKSLEDVYGSRNPIGTFVFVRLRPFHLKGTAMPGMTGTETDRHSH